MGNSPRRPLTPAVPPPGIHLQLDAERLRLLAITAINAASTVGSDRSKPPDGGPWPLHTQSSGGILSGDQEC
jgi:hypothetical protein